MKNRTQVILSICFTLFFGAVSLNGQEAQVEAYNNALNNIQKNKAVEKNKETLKLTLDKLVSNLTSRKATLVKYGKLAHLEQALLINKQAQNHIAKAQKYLVTDYSNRLKSLTEEYAKLKNECAKRYFIQGEHELATAQENNDKALGRAAFKSFQKSANYEYAEQDRLIDLLHSSFEFAQVILGIILRANLITIRTISRMAIFQRQNKPIIPIVMGTPKCLLPSFRRPKRKQ